MGGEPKADSIPGGLVVSSSGAAKVSEKVGAKKEATLNDSKGGLVANWDCF